jgi:hypothetical protein
MNRSLSADELPANYRNYAVGDGQPILAAFSDLDALYPRLRAVTLAGLPASFAMIEPAEREMRKLSHLPAWDDRKKKFLGLCTLYAMSFFGHAPLRVKRAIPHPSFSRGEVYQIADYEPVPLASKVGATLATAAEIEP